MTVVHKYALHKESYGQGESVVMLHGWAMHTGVWRTFAQRLAENCNVVCIDLPGHGLSPKVSPYTLESVADAIYKELPQHVCTLIGWSLGGNIALRLAEKYPLRIKAVILIASNPHFIKTPFWPGVDFLVLKEFARNLQKNGNSTLLRFMSLQIQGKTGAKSTLKQIKKTVQEYPAPLPEVLMNGLAILQTVDQIEVLNSLKQPVLMILGEKDTLVPVLVGERFRLSQVRIKVKIIAEAGHIPFITNQQQVLTLVQDFLLKSNA